MGAFEFLREAIAGTFAGGYGVLCAQARRVGTRPRAGWQQRRREAHRIEAGGVYGCLRFADCGCLVQWHDSRFGSERSRVQFPEQPFAKTEGAAVLRRARLQPGVLDDGQAPQTLCPSGLRGWTQVPLARAASVQIPQVSCLTPWHRSSNGRGRSSRHGHAFIRLRALAARRRTSTVAAFLSTTQATPAVASTAWPGCGSRAAGGVFLAWTQASEQACSACTGALQNGAEFRGDCARPCRPNRA